ncbi:MAG TPA: SRPBCC family protein [Vicinamibacterales bacterium]
MSEKKLEIIAEPGKTSFSTRRVVDAPRSLVFECFTKCEHLKRWIGPRSLTMVSCETDLRVGGRYRQVFQTPNGEVAFSGEFREVTPPSRVVRTFIFEPMPDAEALETLELMEANGQTIITTTTVHKTVENRDGHVNSGVDKGMAEGYTRLDELLASLMQPR